MDKKIKKFLKKIWWFMFSLLTLVGGILTGFPVCNNNYVYVTANDTPTEHICRRRVSQNPKECNTYVYHTLKYILRRNHLNTAIPHPLSCFYSESEKFSKNGHIRNPSMILQKACP